MPSVIRIHRKAPVAEQLECILLSLYLLVFYVTNRVREEGERPARGDLWIELANRARRGVPRVCINRLPLIRPLFIHGIESRQREIDLPANFHERDVIRAR